MYKLRWYNRAKSDYLDWQTKLGKMAQMGTIATALTLGGMSEIGCSGGGGNAVEPQPQQPTRLQSPTVTVHNNGTLASWNAIYNAKDYTVNINNQETTTTDTT